MTTEIIKYEPDVVSVEAEEIPHVVKSETKYVLTEKDKKALKLIGGVVLAALFAFGSVVENKKPENEER